jgi:phosphopantetheinyl transferase (holo-ACP synthase)
VIKAIHSEGDKQANAAGRCIVGQVTRLFPDRSLINFHLLKTLRIYVEKLEVWNNTFWEWENAIFEGCDMFFQLCTEKQGTVHVDLTGRKLTFTPTVSPGIQGLTVGLGMGATVMTMAAHNAASVLSTGELAWATDRDRVAETVAAKQAILEALGMDKDAQVLWSQIEVRLDVGNRVFVKVMKEVQARAWLLRAVDYKAAFNHVSGSVFCTVTAIADMRDISK